MAIGITEEQNVFLEKKYQEINHNSYLVSANGIIYSSHSSTDNWYHSAFKIYQGNTVLCRYDASRAEMLFINS